jgi:hypothetical protein
MDRFVPPLCFLLALAMLISGFALWAVDAPEADVRLHRARLSGDPQLRDKLEADLRRHQRTRNVLLACLFVGSGVLTVTAFATMRPAESR